MEMLDQFNWVDLALAVVLVVTLLVGFSLGFYRQVALLMGVLTGLFVAGRFTPTVTRLDFLATPAEQLGESGLRVAVYLTLAAIPLALALLSFLAFPKIFGKTLRIVDSMLGGAAGLTWATILIWFCLLGTAAGERSWLIEPVGQSYLGPHLAKGGSFVARLFPQALRARFSDGIQRQLDPLLESPPEDRDQDRRG